MSETVYKQGDTVRVMTVGEVMTLEPNYLAIRVADGGSSWIPKGHIESVEVIRSPLTVGNTYTAEELLTARPPFGTVIRTTENGVLATRAGDFWYFGEPFYANVLLEGSAEILYLPPDLPDSA